MHEERLLKNKARTVMLEDLGFELLAMEVTLKLVNAKILALQRSRENLDGRPGRRPLALSAAPGTSLLGLVRSELRGLEAHRLGLEQNIEALTDIRDHYQALTFTEAGES